MKRSRKNSLAIVIIAFFVFAILGFAMPNTAFAVAGTAPTLGAASSYAVLATSGVTCTGASIIKGEVGSSANPSIIGFPAPCTVVAPSTTHPNDASAIAGKAAILTAYGQLAANPVGVALNLGINNTVTPGVYEVGAVDLNGSTLTLDGPGVYIFRSSSSLTDAAGGSTISLTNGAKASDVYWQIPTSMSIGAGTQMVGTIIADTGAITIGTGATLNGRALTKGTTVTLDANAITVPTYLHLRKTVDNTGGGTALNTDWTLTATGTGGSPTNLTGTTPVDSSSTFQADTYTLAESGGPVGYTAGTYSCVNNGGAPVISNSITLDPGDDATCTITNTFIPPAIATLTLVKTVVNDNSGSAVTGDFQAKIDGVNVPWGIAQTVATGVHTASEVGLSGYNASVWGGACAADGTVTLAPGDNLTCTITNDDAAPPSAYTTPPVVPPLIDVVKVPSPLALPAGPGVVDYSYTLTNIGTVPVTNITMADNSCSPLTLTSGDTNSDSKLDVTETWIYHCSKTVSATHTNIVTATGWANGVSATDIASATVVVGVPTVPPLIHITKVPNPLALNSGGGMVTYTKRVTNPGTVPLSNVQVTDDKCSPVTYISGDTNSNSMLDTTETWTYTCQKNLTQTTTNTAIATGTANGLTATDFAIATVVVAGAIVNVIPTLPNTGAHPAQSNILIIAGIFVLVLVSAVVVLRKRQFHSKY